MSETSWYGRPCVTMVDKPTISYFLLTLCVCACVCAYARVYARACVGYVVCACVHMRAALVPVGFCTVCPYMRLRLLFVCLFFLGGG